MSFEPHSLMGLTGRTDLKPFAEKVTAALTAAVEEAAG